MNYSIFSKQSLLGKMIKRALNAPFEWNRDYNALCVWTGSPVLFLEDTFCQTCQQRSHFGVGENLRHKFRVNIAWQRRSLFRSFLRCLYAVSTLAAVKCFFNRAISGIVMDAASNSASRSRSSFVRYLVWLLYQASNTSFRTRVQ